VARNPFEQLQDVLPEPRQAFEDIVSIILKCLYPDSRRTRIYRGDGGIDTYSGNLGHGGEADVCQMKYFPGIWSDSQRQQIRDAYKTARNSTDYSLRKWTLCVPARLRKEDLRWFDEWRAEQDRQIGLRDGDDLTIDLEDARCGRAREKLREWGLVAVPRSGVDFEIRGFIRPQDARRGLRAEVIVQLQNRGDKTARNILAIVSHSETGCMGGGAQIGWEECGGGRVNPRTLRYPNAINPTDRLVIMQILLCERSVVPFKVEVRLTAEDTASSVFRCELDAEQLLVAQPVELERV
jgi:hypothetical protein